MVRKNQVHQLNGTSGTSDGILLDSGLTHDELAACVGTAREVISQDLAQLQREGLVRSGRGQLTLPSLSRLEALSFLALRAKNSAE